MVKNLRPREVDAWLKAENPDGKPFLLDVREAWELQTAPFPAPADCTLLHLPMRETPARLGELAPHRPLLVICHYGSRSMQVAHFLVQQGFTDVTNLAGGIEAWATEVDPAVARY